MEWMDEEHGKSVKYVPSLPPFLGKITEHLKRLVRRKSVAVSGHSSGVDDCVCVCVNDGSSVFLLR